MGLGEALPRLRLGRLYPGDQIIGKQGAGAVIVHRGLDAPRCLAGEHPALCTTAVAEVWVSARFAGRSGAESVAAGRGVVGGVGLRVTEWNSGSLRRNKEKT